MLFPVWPEPLPEELLLPEELPLPDDPLPPWPEPPPDPCPAVDPPEPLPPCVAPPVEPDPVPPWLLLPLFEVPPAWACPPAVDPLLDEPPLAALLPEDEPLPVVALLCAWFVGGVGLLDTALSRLDPPSLLPQAAVISSSTAAPIKAVVRCNGKPAGWADGLDWDAWPKDGRTIMMSAPANKKIPEEDPAWTLCLNALACQRRSPVTARWPFIGHQLPYICESILGHKK